MSQKEGQEDQGTFETARDLLPIPGPPGLLAFPGLPGTPSWEALYMMVPNNAETSMICFGHIEAEIKW